MSCRVGTGGGDVAERLVRTDDVVDFSPWRSSRLRFSLQRAGCDLVELLDGCGWRAPRGRAGTTMQHRSNGSRAITGPVLPIPEVAGVYQRLCRPTGANPQPDVS